MWGKHTCIDLKKCDESMIKSEMHIKFYVQELIILLDMKPYGETIIKHFGDNPKVAGFTMVQMIETSLISGHFVNISQDAFIDIFSCKDYGAQAIADFTKQYFKAKEMTFHLLTRG